MLTATGRRRKLPDPPVRVTENDIKGRRRKPYQPMSFRHDIQGLRALAIMMVVSMHVGLLDIHGGVDISFVISGFLNVSIMLKELDRDGRLNIRGNLAKRFRRIVPGAALVIAVTALLAWIYTPLQFKKTAIDGSFAAVSLLNWRLVEEGTDYFANDGNQGLFQHYWSLCIEEQFYLLAPLVLATTAWVGRRFFKSNRRVMGVLMLGVIGWSFYSCVTLTGTNQPLAYFSTYTRIWELGIGVMLALMAQVLSNMNRTFAAILSWLGLGVILVTAMMISNTTPLPGVAVLGPVLGTAMIVAGGCAGPKYAFGWCKHWAVKIIADTSYSLYLIHWPVLLLWEPIVGTPVNSFNERMRVVAVSFLLSCVTYYPYMKRVRDTKKLARRPHFSLAMFGAAISSVAAMSLVAAFQMPINIPSASAAPQATQKVGTAAVIQAVNQKQLPGNVQPTLVNAPKDMAKKGCIDQLEETSFSMRDECVIGDPSGTKTIVLLGDSHAYQWGETLHLIGKRDGIRVVTMAKAACSPTAYNTYNNNLKRTYTECESWRESAIKAIDGLHAQAVVVTGRTQKGAKASDAKKTYEALEAIGAKVIYLTDTPYPYANIPNCLASYANNLDKCVRTTEQALDEPDVRAMELSVAKASDAKVIDTVPAFCTDKVCPPVIAGIIAYYDYSHMSATYARALVPFLEPKLKAALAA